MNNSPYILYLSILITTCLMAHGIENNRRKVQIKGVKPFFFILSFLIPALFITFTDTGADYYSYYNIIANGHSLRSLVEDVNTEPLFTLWSTTVWAITPNPHIVIWTMKMGCLIALFYSFYILRDKIDLFLAISSYMCIAYFLSFYLISINLAACAICLAFAFLIKKRVVKGVIVALVSCGFHYSAALAFLPLVAYRFVATDKIGKKISTWRIILVVIVTILAFYSFTSIISSLVLSYDQLEHYNKYLDNMREGGAKGLGIIQIVFYIPIAYILYKIYNNKNYPNSIFVLFLFFSAFGFASAELGYVIPILIRSFFIFIPIFCIILPYYVDSIRRLPHKSDGFFTWKQIRLIALLYFMFRLYLTFNEYINPSATSDLYSYHFFNPFS